MSKSSRAILTVQKSGMYASSIMEPPAIFVGVDHLRVAIPGSVRKLPHPVPVKMGANVRMTNQSMLTAAVFPGSQQP